MSILDIDKSIIIQTRKGNNIQNFQNPEISVTNQNQFNRIETKYEKATRRTEPTGLYNCHGFTFASKRCFVEQADQISMILEDDEYQEVELKKVLPGDIVIYFSDGDAEHSGIVIGKSEPPFYVPLVISKWSCHSEFIHYANYCPYDCSNIKYFRIIK
jgi:hypothetical protein